ncbi:SapC family protein [[Limnothrix rosea] IAM M-220]|uniref:SapC family protein n=1 Tax=[Limnothrix rosea] IAM M-220 TaxID=454133 RepID=UPI00095E6230|nr:SapC family protein [[Limnothrix rosea] IAM M-220]OKH17141.1 multidrug transporter [[Limnothrix rosea] IAM M-220]
MTKQLLIYENTIPLSVERHKKWCLQNTSNFSFAKDVNAFPLLGTEFSPAALIYPIVFVKTESILYPSIITGIKDHENFFVTKSGEWQADYIPAFVRRYPFIFSISEDQKTFTVCIDESFDGWNQNGSGERLFDSEENQTQYLKNVVAFLRDYQASFLATEAFSRKLMELNLLEGMQASLTINNVVQKPFQGFLGINRDKLKSLTPEVLYEFMQLGWLELIYLHLHSLNHFSRLTSMMSDRLNDG